ncbi:type I secretion C-terminal target domain-containing protein [Aliamphritea ceti]|uniref:type I secretion C-terminal target domain-containing protein n=1 Tax=Aliamphritea ceti TaxID=1524258 RepID=UPI0021C3145E|nr:type I secretion C-terminal target domain-containing protein [Aliamphritea ceti]
MGVGNGQDIDSDSGQEDHLFMSFDQGVTQISLMVDTNGNASATLRYTVYAVTPAELAMLGQDGFTYTDLPAGGFSGSVVVNDGDTFELDASDAGFSEFTFIVFEADEGEYKLVPDELTVDYLSENQDFSLIAPFNVRDSDFDVAADSINISISGTEDTLTGTNAIDALGGNEEANTLIGGGGDDTLTGGLGSDTFVWNLNDGGSPGDPAEDVITDFDTALPGSDGDVLDLSDLLVDEQNNDLTDYLYFDLSNDGDTVVHISTTGGFNSDFTNVDAVEEQTIELTGIDLVTGNSDQALLIQDLVDNGKLITD